MIPILLAIALYIPFVHWLSDGHWMFAMALDYNKHFDKLGFVFGCFLVAVSFAVACLIGGGVANELGKYFETEIDKKPWRVRRLATLRSNDGVAGSFFFLGIGHIGTQQYYFWYEAASGGLTPRQKAVGQGTYLYEEERQDAEVRVYGWHFTKGWHEWFGFSQDLETWEFHVPKGTLKLGYSVQ